jgi:hypothetical protein
MQFQVEHKVRGSQTFSSVEFYMQFNNFNVRPICFVRNTKSKLERTADSRDEFYNVGSNAAY